MDNGIPEAELFDPLASGSFFQARKSKEERRTLGEHYTNERDILRVLGPLFLDDLWVEFETDHHDVSRLEQFHDKIANIRVLDPACGCGNFLVIAYRELRRLELAVLTRFADIRKDTQMHLDVSNMVRVRLSHFYGIEIEEGPARVAETAMFLVDQQANNEFAVTFGNAPDCLPIMNAANITVGNALRIDWESVLPASECSYIVGNPPFGGSTYQQAGQRADTRHVWGDISGAGLMDYVTNWFILASRYISGRTIRAALVSTNSITQGTHPPILWPVLTELGIGIDFAHQSFDWKSEAQSGAGVHVVIIGFSSLPKPASRSLWVYQNKKSEPLELKAKNINGYLLDGPDVLIKSRRIPLQSSAPKMVFGSMPNDGQHLILSESEAAEVRSLDPIAATYIRSMLGSRELIQGEERYCLWLEGAAPVDIRNSPTLRGRVAGVRDKRLKNNRQATKKLADTPHLFGEIRQPQERYLAVPSISSSTRNYVPIGFLPPEVVATNKLLTIDGADLFVFGLLTSSLFNVWNRAISGRLKSDFQVSIEITYNNFPWPENPKNKAAVEGAAQSILDVREKYSTLSLADLYDPRSMPKDLVDAHKTNDRLVLDAYGLKGIATEADILANLFARYAELTADLFTEHGTFER
jgi:hypothetical protein